MELCDLLKNTKILLIDDEATVLRSIGVVLQTEGHDIVAISDGQKAIEAIKAGGFDLIITDIRMSPVDGMQILTLAHQQQPSTPTIVISAHSSEKTIQESFDLGCVAYVTKPFKIRQVREAVEKALSKP